MKKGFDVNINRNLLQAPTLRYLSPLGRKAKFKNVKGLCSQVFNRKASCQNQQLQRQYSLLKHFKIKTIVGGLRLFQPIFHLEITVFGVAQRQSVSHAITKHTLSAEKQDTEQEKFSSTRPSTSSKSCLGYETKGVDLCTFEMVTTLINCNNLIVQYKLYKN